jgi:hypothetical protein
MLPDATIRIIDCSIDIYYKTFFTFYFDGVSNFELNNFVYDAGKIFLLIKINL